MRPERVAREIASHRHRAAHSMFTKDMRALTVTPGRADSGECRADFPEPAPLPDDLLVETLAVGVCGTDREILDAEYGWAPPGERRLVLGHEALGRVLRAPSECGFAVGDVVVPIVRRPDPEPCASCAVGEWDMCRNGLYTEHGIKQLHGFARDRFALPPAFAVGVDAALGIAGVLLEPTSVVAKAWEHVERIALRARWAPRRVLVTGAGPIGLLAALLGVQRGLDVHVLDRVTDGPKPGLVAALGATYHVGRVEDAGPPPDVVLECTGVGRLVIDVMHAVAPDGIVCLTGVSSRGRTIPVDVADLNRALVLQNNVVFGSVNANRRHYQTAAVALAAANPGWLEQLLTRRIPLERWPEAVERREHDVKTVLELAA